MFQFIESICCLNRKLRHIDLHQKRFDYTRSIHFTNSIGINLVEEIKFPADLTDGKYKVRIVYGEKIESIEFIPYEIKEIKTIQLYEISEEITYKFKFLDRDFLNSYIKETGCDDLILIKNDCITDAIYSNLIFFNGIEWHTPKSPLLKGTMRESLLREGKIIETTIKTQDLNNYYSFKRINAMMNIEEAQIFDIHNLM